jgi:hypothetical protein
LVLLPALALASTQSKGSMGFEGRAFAPEEGEDVDRHDFGTVLVGRLEWKGKQLVSRSGAARTSFREKLRVVGRVAAIDEDRSRLIAEEAWVGWRSKYLRVKAGVQMLTWTATEAFHPADVVNSRNFDGNVENPDKIGEPMVSATLRLAGFHLTGYYLPVRMDPVLPGGDSRLSFGGDLGDPVWVDRDGTISEDRFENQWAARLATTFGSADVALHAIQHNDRGSPAIRVTTATGEVQPLYLFVTQFGLTYAHAVGDVVLKLEGAHRRFEPARSTSGLQFPSIIGISGGAPPEHVLIGADRPNHTIVAAGVEYGWSYETAGQATVLLEGQAVVDVSDREERQALTPFQRDVLVGYRHDFEDIAGTNLTLGAIVDLEGDAVVGTGSFGRRLGDTWSLASSVRLTFADDGPLEPLDGDHYVQLELTRHF